MERKNLTMVLLTMVLIGALAATAALSDRTGAGGRASIAACVLLAALAAWISNTLLREREADEQREGDLVLDESEAERLDRLLTKIEEHLDDEVRPYDPNALGVRLAGLEAAITQVYNAAFTPPKTVLPLPATSPEEEENGGGKPDATPKAKELAEKRDLNVENIPGTGKNGRVLKRDVQELLKDE